MSGPLRGVSAVEDARRAARVQGERLGRAVLPALAAGLALAIVALFVVLDYGLDQSSHRLVKILAGASLVAGVLLRPHLGLLTLPVLTPFLPMLPKLPVPGINALNVALCTVFLAYAIPAAVRREPLFKAGRLGGLLVALVALAGLSIGRGAAFPSALDYDPGFAGQQLLRVSMTFVTYFIGLAMSREPRHRRALVWAVVAGLLVEAVYTILQGRTGRGGRAVGSIGQSNDLGAFLALFTVFSGALWFGVRAWTGRLVLVSALVAGTWGILLSVSRGAMAAVVAGLALVALFRSRMLLVLIGAALVTSPLWAPDYVKERVLSTQVEDETYDEVMLESSSRLRVDTWAAIVDIVLENPIIGVGFNGLGALLPEVGSARGVQVKDSAHSTFLRFLGEMGILGLGLFVWILVASARLGWAAWRQGRDAWERHVGLGFLAVTLATVVNCLFGDRFYQITISGNFWLLAAVVDNQLDREGERA
uniref:O-antigen ligase-related domain-containing protein n=1 Tax=Eiseniibacteriota bacterium TaxID=2212470 RepID=A0A832I123_UNCEI